MYDVIAFRAVHVLFRATRFVRLSNFFCGAAWVAFGLGTLEVAVK